MVKVGVKKQITKKTALPNSTTSAPKINQTEKVLVENFVELQKVIVDLSEKFTNLSSQMSKLLGLFETSAKTLAQKGFEDNKEIVQKIDALLEQNKILAKGIALLHEAEEEIEEDLSKTPSQTQQKPMPPQTQKQALPQLPKPLAPMQTPQQPPTQPVQSQKQAPINIQEYQKSISAQ